ncbi:polyprotein [Petunia chlorotic mottle virus]|uniref:Polyprotein n=1 Tax=Petunia chlorotic mottle virus TaxID=1935922 RepID=A0A1P8J7S9_9SECO|nr:polyprotein [Petunia chlorotic mottle virus]APW29210.1 polyprotein [Petunia chlorotic mottle virus]
MKLDRIAVKSFFLTSPEGLVNLRNIADGASTKAALEYIMSQFDSSADARRRIRAAIRTTEWYKVVKNAFASSSSVAATTPAKVEEDWGPAWAYNECVSCRMHITIDWEVVPMSEVPHKEPKTEPYTCEAVPPMSTWEDIIGLSEAIEALQCAERAELFLALPEEYPHAPEKKNVAVGFSRLFNCRRFERLVEKKGILNDALNFASVTKTEMPLTGQMLHQVQAFAPVGDDSEEASHQAEMREEQGIGTIADLKEKLAKRKAALPRKRGRVEEFKEAGHSRYDPGGGLKVTADDIFTTGSIVKRWLPKSQEPQKPDDVRIDTNHVIKHEMVKYLPSEGPIFKSLPRMTEEQLRKRLEQGWRGQTSVCCDLSIVSHVGYGTPIVVFVALLDTRTTNAEESYLAGSYIDIGRMKASVLSMPLINLPMGDTIEDHDNFLSGLCLVFYYQHVKGFKSGMPLLSYGAIEFSELTAAANYRTKARDSWEQVVRDDKHDRRIIAGLNALQVLEKDLNEPIPSLDAVQIAVPASAVQMPAYLRGGKVIQPSEIVSKKLHIPAMRAPNRTGRLMFESGESSARFNQQFKTELMPKIIESGVGSTRSNSEQETEPMHETTALGQVADHNFLFNKKVKVQKDAKRGAILCSLDLYEEINRYQTARRLDWLRDGLIYPKFKVSIKTTSNQFIGMSIGIALDWFSKFPKNTGLVPLVANEFPSLGPIVLKENEHSFVIDVKETFGTAMSLVVDSFSEAPKWIFYVLTTNQVVQAHDWFFFVEVSLDYDIADEYRGSPLYQYPIVEKNNLVVNRVLGNFSVAGNNPTGELIPLFMARPLETQLGNKFISPWRVYLEHFMGYSGDFVFEFIPCSSAMINCGLRTCMWYNVDTFPSLSEMSFVEHEDLDQRKEFTLSVRAPRGKLATSRNVSKLAIVPLSGVTAPDTMTKDFEYLIKLKRIDNLRMGPRIFTNEWYQLFWIDDFKKDDFKLLVNGYVAEIKSQDVKILMNQGIFSHMIACTGFHEGMLDVRITWSYANKLGNVEGHITFLHGFCSPRKLTGAAAVIANSKGIYEAESINVGSMAGPVSGRDTDQNKWIEFHFWKGTQIEQFHIMVRPHENFRFYGDSCIATTIPST